MRSPTNNSRLKRESGGPGELDDLNDDISLPFLEISPLQSMHSLVKPINISYYVPAYIRTLYVIFLVSYEKISVH